MSAKSNTETSALHCYHCGDECSTKNIYDNDKFFCCQGCKTVYQILEENDLCNYYDLESNPGLSPKAKSDSKFEYLEHQSIQDELLDFQDDRISKVQFYLPQIHCSSCLWLIENLYKLSPGIINSRVNFLKKEVYLTFEHEQINLRQVVELLASLGYEPSITLDQLKSERKKPISRRLIYQVGLAGFAFGNIMLLSLPEYFGFDSQSLADFSYWFSWLNLALATPVAFYSGQDYFKSAYTSLKRKRLNIDVPIALGILVLYLRSLFEIISETGAGYFDSLCGLLFFLLLGRIFQEKVYHQLSFERDYRSYFPISINRIEKGKESSTPVQEIKKGDRIIIRNGELIPVDGYLIDGKASIDNSFATGESNPVSRKIGDKLFAGGRQLGEAITLEVIRPLEQSKLTRLWSEHAAQAAEKDERVSFSELTDQISQWFTPIILLIAFGSGAYHWSSGIGQAIEVMCAVLIVACPCALALAAPFTFGHAMRYLGRFDCYLREAGVIERMARINHLIFDKTGTLTYSQNRKVKYSGKVLSKEEEQTIQAIFSQSNHPLSRILSDHLPESPQQNISDFEEVEGKGLKGKINQIQYRLGSATWLGVEASRGLETMVGIEINGEYKGYFGVSNQYRKGLKELLNQLKTQFSLSMISGDNDGQKEVLKDFFPAGSELRFNQSPKDKLNYIDQLQDSGKKCMMVGDGLNDAGALLKSDVGVSIAENVNAFSPACDIILGADRFDQLNKFLSFSKQSKNIVLISFGISFLYNIVGLAFAVQGLLSPVFAAILMPVSSISVVGFVSFSVWLSSRLKLTSS